MSTKQSFQIFYDGPALTSHEMDVRDLAPALVAVGDLFEETNKVLYGDKTKVQVNVKGSFKAGTFHVDFNLSQDVIQQVADLFNISRDASAQMILAVLGIPTVGVAANGAINLGKMGLIQFIKWLKNRKIKTIERQTEGGFLTITVDDETIETYPEVIDLFRNVKVRRSLEVIVNKPLSREGIDVFAFKNGENNTEEKVEKQEAQLFETPEVQDEQLEDEVYETDLQLTLISFKEGNKWKFTDGSVEFMASVNDEEFVQKVQDSKASFSKDDILKVKVRKKKWISDTGIKSDYEIEKVISHRPSSKQIPLFIEGQKD